jgi:hypothetical protein
MSLLRISDKLKKFDSRAYVNYFSIGFSNASKQLFFNLNTPILNFSIYDPEQHKLKLVHLNTYLIMNTNQYCTHEEKWGMFAKEMENPNTIQTLKIINNYNTFIKKIEK